MSKLIITFDPYVSDSGPALIPLEILDGQLRLLRDAPQTLALNQPREVDVPAGEFLVRGFLPNGEMMSEQVKVHENETVPVPLRPEIQSPSESLAWGYLLKGTLHGAMEAQSTIAETTRGLNQPTIKLTVWECDGPTWTVRDDLRPELMDQDLPGSFGVVEVSPFDHLLWMQVNQSDWRKFIALPPGPMVRINLLQPTPDDDDPIEPIVDAGDPQAETILGFLRRGDFAHARTVGTDFAKTAERLLQAKVQDVASAAIGGYFLLLAGDIERLHDWTRNLDEWFNFFPDGAVIHGWHCLRQPSPDFSTARLRFIEAANRGVPVYTSGLRLLHDGLVLMAAKSREEAKADSAVESALARIQPFAAIADWAAATTSFFGASPPQVS